MSILCAGLAASAIASTFEVPLLAGHVNDLAELLSPEVESELDALLTAHERQTSNQVVLLTVTSLSGVPIEDVALRIAETWRLGQKGRDNGALLLIARDDREVRFEVGYGLEGSLPDALCARIIEGEIVPRFRRGDFEDGARAGLRAALAAVAGEYTPTPGGDGDGVGVGDGDENAGAGETDGFQDEVPLEARLIVAGMFYGVVGLFTFLGLAAPAGAGWFLYFFLIPFWLTFPIVVLGARGALIQMGFYLVGYPLLRWRLPKTKFGQAMIAAVGTSASGSGRGRSTSRSGSSYRSSSSSRSFSGGGGRFGGGGSSGRW